MPCHPTVRAGLALTLFAVAVTAGSQTAKRQERERHGEVKSALVLPPATVEQLAAAARAFFGAYACEFNEVVTVDRNRLFDGYLDVKHRKSVWTTRPVLSQTGALRLEDVTGRMLWLQIAEKSMLMDTAAGRRVVDNCVHEQQRLVAPARPEDSLGIAPAKLAAVQATAAATSAASATTPAALATKGLPSPPATAVVTPSLATAASVIAVAATSPTTAASAPVAAATAPAATASAPAETAPVSTPPASAPTQ